MTALWTSSADVAAQSSSRKIDTLLRECSDYMALHLKSAELLDSEREAVKRQVIGEKQVMADVKSELRLIVRHAMGGTRAIAAAIFEPHQSGARTSFAFGFRLKVSRLDQEPGCSP